jgi:hypothetical protein
MAAAFNTNTMNDLTTALRNLYYRRQRIGKLLLTFEEYIQTFVPYEARDIIRNAAPYTAATYRSHKWHLRLLSGDAVNATLAIHETSDHAGGAYAPPVMRHLVIQGDAPSEITERIYSWVERGGNPSRDFGRVLSVLNILNVNFSRVAIRYYWPTILALMSETGKMGDTVQEGQDLKQPARLKPLPPGLSQACRLTAETIATTRLIPSDAAEPDSAGMTVLDIVSGQQYKEAFGTFWGMT